MQKNIIHNRFTRMIVIPLTSISLFSTWVTIKTNAQENGVSSTSTLMTESLEDLETENTEQTVTLRVTDEKGNFVSGAVFEVVDETTGKTIRTITTSDKVCIIENLPFHTHMAFKQISTAEGKTIAEPISGIYLTPDTENHFKGIGIDVTNYSVENIGVTYKDEDKNIILEGSIIGAVGTTLKEENLPTAPKWYYFTDTYTEHPIAENEPDIVRSVKKKILSLTLVNDEGISLPGSKFEIRQNDRIIAKITVSDIITDLTTIPELKINETYTIEHSEASPGYRLEEPIEFTITDDAETQNLVFINNKTAFGPIIGLPLEGIPTSPPKTSTAPIPTPTSTPISKVTAEPIVLANPTNEKPTFTVNVQDDNNNSVDGAVFEIIETNTKNPVTTLTTENGIAEYNGLEYEKSYTIKQVSAEEGYTTVSYEREIFIDKDTDSQTFYYINPFYMPENENPEPLNPTPTATEDITVKYVDNNGVTVLSESITKTEGETLKESDLPESPKWYYFTDTFTEHVVVKEEPDITRSVAKKALPFIVTDGEGNNVEGSTFDIMEGDKKVATFTTTNKPYDLTEIPAIDPNKTYTIKQTSAPKGYEMTATPISITVTDNANKQEVKVTNAKEVVPTTEDITVKYADENGVTVLSESITKTEGETLKKSDLPESPKWYYFTDTFTEHVVVKEEPDITRSVAKKALPFIVIDGEGNNVEGSTFDIMEGDKKVATFTTTNKPYDLTEIPEIDPNKTYTIKQTSAPKGYEMTATPISITVTDNADKQEVKVTNAKEVVPTTEDIGVKYVDNNGVTVLSDSITKTEGETLKESDLPESPKWYYFTDTFTEHVVVKEEPDITRSVAKKALPFIVTDNEGNNVEGSTFDIMEGDKKVATFTTANKPYDLTEIPAIDPNKTYTIKQTSAPKGYEMTTSSISITVTDNANKQEVKITNAKEAKENHTKPLPSENKPSVTPSLQPKPNVNTDSNTAVASKTDTSNLKVSDETNTPAPTYTIKQTTPNTGISEVGSLLGVFIMSMLGAMGIGMIKHED